MNSVVYSYIQIAGDKHTKLQTTSTALKYDCNHKLDLLGKHQHRRGHISYKQKGVPFQGGEEDV